MLMRSVQIWARVWLFGGRSRLLLDQFVGGLRSDVGLECFVCRIATFQWLHVPERCKKPGQESSERRGGSASTGRDYDSLTKEWTPCVGRNKGHGNLTSCGFSCRGT